MGNQQVTKIKINYEPLDGGSNSFNVFESSSDEEEQIQDNSSAEAGTPRNSGKITVKAGTS